MGLRLITAPVDAPVTLDEIKSHLNVEDDDFDDDITALIGAAVAYLDGPTGLLQMALEEQEWEATYDGFPVGVTTLTNWTICPIPTVVELQLPPLLAVESIKYDDVNGDEQTLDASLYAVDNVSKPGRVVFGSSFVAPSTLANGVNTVRIRFTAGYPQDEPDEGETGVSVSTVPKAIQHAIKMMVGDMFAMRETVSENQTWTIPVSATVEMLLRPFKPFIIA